MKKYYCPKDCKHLKLWLSGKEYRCEKYNLALCRIKRKPIKLFQCMNIRSDMKKFKIGIDFGNGGKFTGAINYTLNKSILTKNHDDKNIPLYEKDLNLHFGMKLYNYLYSLNCYEIILIRGYDRHFSRFQWNDLRLRAKRANNENCDLFISIHFNSPANPDDHVTWGTEIITSLGETKSDFYAQKILEKMGDIFDWQCFTFRSKKNRKVISENRFKIRGEKDMNLSVLWRTKMPAILWEVDFMSNNDRVMWALNPKHQGIMFRAIHEGIEETIKQQRKKV